jgi:E3 ubiquitin-protein ligase RNF216
MFHCNSASEQHWFCLGCVTNYAEIVIALGRYDLICMSLEGCTSGFDEHEREVFLSYNMQVALLRNEQHAKNPAIDRAVDRCPLCSHSCQAFETNQELQCQNPECGLVSCQLCQMPSHLSKTCEEIKSERPVRIQIEEARSEAVIRRCTECKLLRFSIPDFPVDEEEKSN